MNQPRRRISVWVLALGLVVGAGSSRADDIIYFWTNTASSGTWQDNTAWDPNGPFTDVNTDSAFFTNAATYLVSLTADVNVQSNFFSNASNTTATVTLDLGTYKLTAAYSVSSPGAFVVGDLGRSTTTVYFASSPSPNGLSVPQRLVVGRNGIGTLIVTNGLVTVGSSTVIGSGGTGRGTLVISGPNTIWSDKQIVVGNNSNSFGNVLVISNSAVVTMTSNFRVGSGSSSGGGSNNTFVLDGAFMSVASGHSVIGNGSTITFNAEANNNVAIIRNGGVWDNRNHTLYVGRNDQASAGGSSNMLTILTGGRVTNVSNLIISPTNTLDLLGGIIDATTTNDGTVQGYGTFLSTLYVTANAVLGTSNSVSSLVFSNSLNLFTGAVVQVELGTTTYPTVVASNLQIRTGTWNITNSAGFGPGSYTVFSNVCNCATQLTYEVPFTTNVPDASLNYEINTNTPGVVKLIVTTPSTTPVASFTASPTNGPAPLRVVFTDTSTGGSITNLYWSFGDGNATNTPAGAIVTNTYATSLNAVVQYTATLTAMGPGGNSNATALITAITDPYTAWRLRYFPSCAGCAQGNADPYGKGMSNTNQFLAGLNPTNANSVLRITSIVATNPTSERITWKTSSGDPNATSFNGPTVITNVVQGAVGAAGGAYNDIFYDISGRIIIVPSGSGDTTTNYVDQGGTNRYYRIRLAP